MIPEYPQSLAGWRGFQIKGAERGAIIMEKRNRSTILERLTKRKTFPLHELYEAKSNSYLAPLAELILASEQIAKQALEPWEFKSLAQMGIEDFILTGNFYGYDDEKWQQNAQQELAYCVNRNIYYESDEGLLFFVRADDGKFRVARKGDESYDFVRRLNNEGSVSDLRFTQPPTWSKELFLARENWEAYKLMWHDNSSTSNPQYLAHKKMGADAVIRETVRRMGSIPGLLYEADLNGTSVEKPVSTKERTTFLTIIALLAQEAKIDSRKPSKAAQLIVTLANKAGIQLGQRTVEEYLKQIPDALERRGKSDG